MAQLDVLVNGTTLVGDAARVTPGESIDFGLAWKNADGSDRDMLGATVQAKVWASGPVRNQRSLLATVEVPDLAKLSIPAATTAAWTPGKRLRVELWETRSSKVLVGAFPLLVD